jgi:hypothetical protein
MVRTNTPKPEQYLRKETKKHTTALIKQKDLLLGRNGKIQMLTKADPSQARMARGACGVGVRPKKEKQSTSQVEAAKVLDVPRVRQLSVVFRGQSNQARPGDTDHFVRSFLHW